MSIPGSTSLPTSYELSLRSRRRRLSSFLIAIKVLLLQMVSFGGDIIRAICAHHLMNNFTVKFSRTLKPLFWRLCRAKSVTRFDALIEELRELNAEAATYLLLVEPKLWAKARFVGTRFSHDTSKQAYKYLIVWVIYYMRSKK
jgi:hypothetical protein